MDKAETAAKSIVENLIPGARMRYNETQSAGQHDFDLEYSTGMTVPLEVTISTDEAAESTEAAIKRSRKGGPFVPRIQCQHDWQVHPIQYAYINEIRLHVDGCLAAIEAEGRAQFDSCIDSAESEAVYAIFHKLGIEYGSVTKWKSPGIGIATPGGGGLVDPALVNAAVEIEAHKDDNKRKLSSTEGSEKHLFVYVTPTRHVVWVAVRDGRMPVRGPQLPPEITHVWIATWAGSGAWHTVWQSDRSCAWTHMGQVNIETGAVTAPREGVFVE